MNFFDEYIFMYFNINEVCIDNKLFFKRESFIIFIFRI